MIAGISGLLLSQAYEPLVSPSEDVLCEDGGRRGAIRMTKVGVRELGTWLLRLVVVHIQQAQYSPQNVVHRRSRQRLLRDTAPIRAASIPPRRDATRFRGITGKWGNGRKWAQDPRASTRRTASGVSRSGKIATCRLVCSLRPARQHDSCRCLLRRSNILTVSVWTADSAIH